MLNISLKNLILFFSVAIVMYCLRRNKEGMVNTSDIKQIVKEEINNIYKGVNIESFRNLSLISEKLQDGRLKIPGNLTIGGNIQVNGTSNLRGNLTNNNINNKLNNLNNQIKEDIKNKMKSLDSKINGINSNVNSINNDIKQRFPNNKELVFPHYGKIVAENNGFFFTDLNGNGKKIYSNGVYCQWKKWR